MYFCVCVCVCNITLNSYIQYRYCIIFVYVLLPQKFWKYPIDSPRKGWYTCLKEESINADTYDNLRVALLC